MTGKIGRPPLALFSSIRYNDGMKYVQQIEAFQPSCEQERSDRALVLSLVQKDPALALTRGSAAAHMTASSMIFNPSRDRVLLAFHKLYQSWAWTGGHADGDGDLLAVALREAQEETGIVSVRPLSPDILTLDVLPVWGHVKRGAYVSTHLHLNVSYALVASEDQALYVRPDENEGVRWIEIDQLEQFVSEPEMLPVYRRLIACGRNLP